MPMSPSEDPFQSALYDQLNDSAVQQKFRRIRPWPVGAVFIEWPDMSEADIREQFRLMKQLGFNCLKQVCVGPRTDVRKVMHMALDEGIIPWWYGEGGWENPTPDRLAALGLPADLTPQQLREHPVWLKRQETIMRQRIDQEVPALHMTAGHGADDLPGTLRKFEYGLPPELAAAFTRWLQAEYGDVEGLRRVWNFHHTLIPCRDWRTWEEVEAEVIELVGRERQEYRRIRDVLRFKTELFLEGMRAKRDQFKAEHPEVPIRAGGEMGLFLPYALFGTDFEAIARLMRDAGSFYPSMHASWHYEEVDFELLRPTYIQASMAHDWFKGGWSATWESTAGPQQLTGGKAPFWEPARSRIPGATVDGRTLEQLMLSWIAAGFKGFGLWTWNPRSAGWEAGEYGLLDKDNLPTGRAQVAGTIGKACSRLRDELWEARKEPLVGIFHDWNTDAIWSAMSIGGRDRFRTLPTFARIGAARSLINGNVPWEFVSATDIRRGLAGRYRAILLPTCLALDEELLTCFAGYVERGGRLVLDAPGGYFDTFGRLLSSRPGSLFERLFGVRIANLQYSDKLQRPWYKEGRLTEGFTMDLVPTRADVRETFDDGKAAVTEHRFGQGTAVVLGWQASLSCSEPGRTEEEIRLRRLVVGPLPVSYVCEECIVYRLSAPAAEHYFFLNDRGQPITARLKTNRDAAAVASAEDAVTGERLPGDGLVEVPAHGGRWIRLVRSR